MLRELESLKPPANLCSIYDTMNVILERKLNLPLKEFEIEVDTALKMFEKRSPRETNFPEMARFYLNKVLYADYKKQHSIDVIKRPKCKKGAASGRSSKVPKTSNDEDFETDRGLIKW